MLLRHSEWDSRKRYLVWLLFLLPSLLGVSCSDDDGPSGPEILGELVVWPSAATDTVVERTVNPDRVGIKVDCPPNHAVDFWFQCDASWLTLTNVDGTSSGVTRDSFAIRFNVLDLPAGTYTDSVVITSPQASNSPQFVEVTCVVEPRQPLIDLVPGSLKFEVSTLYEIPDPKSFVVASFDGGNWTYTLDESIDWITCSQGTGITPDTIEVNAGQLLARTGTNRDTAWVRSDDMFNSPWPMIFSLVMPPWVPQQSPFPSCLYRGVAFADTQRGWIVGSNDQSGYTDGFILQTENGGYAWTVAEYYAASLDQYRGLFAIDRTGDNLWAVGQGGMIIHSPDLGETWEVVTTEFAPASSVLLDVDFVSEQAGWIVGAGGLILNTTDGGLSWVKQTNPYGLDLWDVCFIDELHGWTVGQSGASMRTVDGGDTWVRLGGLSMDCRDVWFADASNGWAAGFAKLSHTTDGGQTWAVQQETAGVWFRSVCFVDEVTGWAVSSVGDILFTNDAGNTWTLQIACPDESFYGVGFIDSQTGWVVGLGLVMYTSSGGSP